MSRKILLKNGTVITQNSKRTVTKTDILVIGKEIKKISPNQVADKDTQIINCKNQFVLPGLIQAHTHLCQILFRGLADDMQLIDWLKKRIWPMESNHTKDSLQASAALGLLEMQLTGTTTILDMCTVQNTDSIFAEVQKSKMRYFGGKCLMDHKKFSGPLYEETKTSIYDTERLIERWHKSTDLIQYALSPRFAVSCTDEILKHVVAIQKRTGVLIHTHASESLEEIAIVKKRTRLNNIDYLYKLGLLNPRTVIAHGVHMTDNEVKKMVKTKTGLVHCPSSNLKLSSGIAPIEKYKNAKMKLSMGADGAPCNNTMDVFLEMRLTALLQKPIFGPTAMPAKDALDMATLGGAKVLGLEKKIGSIEEGKLADIITVDRSHPSVATVEDPYSAIVYSCSGRDVKNVFINGEYIVKNGQHQFYNVSDVNHSAKVELQKLMKRANIQ
jgi:5-methylthioadenosine/S-adenosylhomocysteine deaminase